MINLGDLAVFVAVVGIVATYLAFLRSFINAAESDNQVQHA